MAIRTPSPVIVTRRRADGAADLLQRFAESLASLASKGYKPVLAPAFKVQTSALGISLDSRVRADAEQYARSYVAAGEVLVKDEYMIVCLARHAVEPHFTTEGMYEMRPADTMAFYVFAIGPTPSPGPLGEVTDTLASDLGIDFTAVHVRNDRFKELLAEGMEPAPKLDHNELAAAQCLVDPDARALAVAVKTSGGLLLSDVEKQFGSRDGLNLESAQRALSDAGLIDTETVVICSRTNRQVARAPSAKALQDLAKRGLRCACGAEITDERSEDALTMSQLGRVLLDGSRWMSILLLHELGRFGIDPSGVAIEQVVGGDELDCVAVIEGRLVLFELKDKEFNLGNAYSFGAKIAVVRPDVSVIVTSEHVGGDARDHFARIQAAPRDNRRRLTIPARDDADTPSVEYIEGLHTLDTRLTELVTRISSEVGRGFLEDVLPFATLDAAATLAAFLERPASNTRPRTRSSARPSAGAKPSRRRSAQKS